MPSGPPVSRGYFDWNRSTAASVLGPKAPSTKVGASAEFTNAVRTRAHWSARTQSPEEPLARSTAGTGQPLDAQRVPTWFVHDCR